MVVFNIIHVLSLFGVYNYDKVSKERMNMAVFNIIHVLSLFCVYTCNCDTISRERSDNPI